MENEKINRCENCGITKAQLLTEGAYGSYGKKKFIFCHGKVLEGDNKGKEMNICNYCGFPEIFERPKPLPNQN